MVSQSTDSNVGEIFEEKKQDASSAKSSRLLDRRRKRDAIIKRHFSSSSLPTVSALSEKEPELPPNVKQQNDEVERQSMEESSAIRLAECYDATKYIQDTKATVSAVRRRREERLQRFNSKKQQMDTFQPGSSLQNGGNHSRAASAPKERRVIDLLPSNSNDTSVNDTSVNDATTDDSSLASKYCRRRLIRRVSSASKNREAESLFQKKETKQVPESDRQRDLVESGSEEKEQQSMQEMSRISQLALQKSLTSNDRRVSPEKANSNVTTPRKNPRPSSVTKRAFRRSTSTPGKREEKVRRFIDRSSTSEIIVDVGNKAPDKGAEEVPNESTKEEQIVPEADMKCEVVKQTIEQVSKDGVEVPEICPEIQNEIRKSKAFTEVRKRRVAKLAQFRSFSAPKSRPVVENSQPKTNHLEDAESLDSNSNSSPKKSPPPADFSFTSLSCSEKLTSDNTEPASAKIQEALCSVDGNNGMAAKLEKKTGAITSFNSDNPFNDNFDVWPGASSKQQETSTNIDQSTEEPPVSELDNCKNDGGIGFDFRPLADAAEEHSEILEPSWDANKVLFNEFQREDAKNIDVNDLNPWVVETVTNADLVADLLLVEEKKEKEFSDILNESSALDESFDPTGWPTLPDGLLTNTSANDAFHTASDDIYASDNDDENLLGRNTSSYESDIDNKNKLSKEERIKLYEKNDGDDSSHGSSDGNEDQGDDDSAADDADVGYLSQGSEEEEEVVGISSASMSFDTFKTVDAADVPTFSYETVDHDALQDKDTPPLEDGQYEDSIVSISDVQLNPIDGMEKDAYMTLLPQTTSSKPPGYPRIGFGDIPPPPPPPPPPPGTKKKRKKKKRKSKLSSGEKKEVPLIAPPPEEKLRKWKGNQNKIFDPSIQDQTNESNGQIDYQENFAKNYDRLKSNSAEGKADTDLDAFDDSDVFSSTFGDKVGFFPDFSLLNQSSKSMSNDEKHSTSNENREEIDLFRSESAEKAANPEILHDVSGVTVSNLGSLDKSTELNKETETEQLLSSEKPVHSDQLDERQSDHARADAIQEDETEELLLVVGKDSNNNIEESKAGPASGNEGDGFKSQEASAAKDVRSELKTVTDQMGENSNLETILERSSEDSTAKRIGDSRNDVDYDKCFDDECGAQVEGEIKFDDIKTPSAFDSIDDNRNGMCAHDECDVSADFEVESENLKSMSPCLSVDNCKNEQFFLEQCNSPATIKSEEESKGCKKTNITDIETTSPEECDDRTKVLGSDAPENIVSTRADDIKSEVESKESNKINITEIETTSPEECDDRTKVPGSDKFENIVSTRADDMKSEVESKESNKINITEIETTSPEECDDRTKVVGSDASDDIVSTGAEDMKSDIESKELKVNITEIETYAPEECDDRTKVVGSDKSENILSTKIDDSINNIENEEYSEDEYNIIAAKIESMTSKIDRTSSAKDNSDYEKCPESEYAALTNNDCEIESDDFKSITSVDSPRDAQVVDYSLDDNDAATSEMEDERRTDNLRTIITDDSVNSAANDPCFQDKCHAWAKAENEFKSSDLQVKNSNGSIDNLKNEKFFREDENEAKVEAEGITKSKIFTTHCPGVHNVGGEQFYQEDCDAGAADGFDLKFEVVKTKQTFTDNSENDGCSDDNSDGQERAGIKCEALEPRNIGVSTNVDENEMCFYKELSITLAKVATKSDELERNESVIPFDNADKDKCFKDECKSPTKLDQSPNSGGEFHTVPSSDTSKPTVTSSCASIQQMLSDEQVFSPGEQTAVFARVKSGQDDFQMAANNYSPILLSNGKSEYDEELSIQDSAHKEETLETEQIETCYVVDVDKNVHVSEMISFSAHSNDGSFSNGHKTSHSDELIVEEDVQQTDSCKELISGAEETGEQCFSKNLEPVERSEKPDCGVVENSEYSSTGDERNPVSNLRISHSKTGGEAGVLPAHNALDSSTQESQVCTLEETLVKTGVGSTVSPERMATQSLEGKNGSQDESGPGDQEDESLVCSDMKLTESALIGEVRKAWVGPNCEGSHVVSDKKYSDEKDSVISTSHCPVLASKVLHDRKMAEKVDLAISAAAEKMMNKKYESFETIQNGSSSRDSQDLSGGAFSPFRTTMRKGNAVDEIWSEVHHFFDDDSEAVVSLHSKSNETSSVLPPKSGGSDSTMLSGERRRYVYPSAQPSPFYLAVQREPKIIVSILEFLGDPVAVSRLKMVNKAFYQYIDDNEHQLMRDAVRLGGMKRNVRPYFWLWVTLQKGDHRFRSSLDDNSVREFNSIRMRSAAGQDLKSIEAAGRAGKWNNVIERDVSRSFGNLPPHKTGARLRTDSIVRALVSWGKSRMMNRGVKGSCDAPPISANDSDCEDAGIRPTDTVSDWGGVTPVGSFNGSFASSISGGNDDSKRKPQLFASKRRTRDEDLALNGNALTDDIKSALQGKLSFILHALAASHPDVGYCQGMDYVVAHLLRILEETILWKAANGTLPSVIQSAPSKPFDVHDFNSAYEDLHKTLVVEETCFRMMDSFFTNYNLQHFYWPELRCLKTCCRVFEKLIQIKLPVLADHFEHHELNVGLFALGWFQTLFLYLPSMPSATVCHMWDIWLVERSYKIFFRVGTAILFLSQPILLNHELEGMMGYLNTFPDATLLSPDILIPCSLQIKVTNRLLMELEQEVVEQM